MTNYFYTDPDGQKQGPVNFKQLQELANISVVVPDTILESADSKVKFAARSFRALNFPRHQFVPPWQFDFASHLWTCQAIKIISGIVMALLGVVVTYCLLQLFGEVDSLPNEVAIRLKILAVAGIAGTWVFVVFAIAAICMLCEWSLITSKAAQLYVERCEKE